MIRLQDINDTFCSLAMVAQNDKTSCGVLGVSGL